MTAIRADTLLGGKIDEFLTDRQPGIIAPLGSVVLRLLAPFPLGLLGVVLGIVQVIGAIVEWLGFRASSKEVGLELPLFTFELLDFLLECRDPFQGIAMATLPISDLLTESKILPFQSPAISAARPIPGRGSPPDRLTPGRSHRVKSSVPVGGP